MRSLLVGLAVASLTCLGVVAVACKDPDPVVGASSSSSSGTIGDGGSSTTEDAEPVEDEDSGTKKDGGGVDPPVPGMKTTLVTTINSIARSMDRTQWGTTAIDGGTGIYAEAYKGGDPACPEQNSPQTDYTLIISNVPRGVPGQKFTLADGVRVNYFDFKGDQFTDAGSGNPILRATSVTVTIVALDTAPKGSVEVEVDATFAQGTAKGRAYATFCDSLSD